MQQLSSNWDKLVSLWRQLQMNKETKVRKHVQEFNKKTQGKNTDEIMELIKNEVSAVKRRLREQSKSVSRFSKTFPKSSTAQKAVADAHVASLFAKSSASTSTLASREKDLQRRLKNLKKTPLQIENQKKMQQLQKRLRNIKK